MTVSNTFKQAFFAQQTDEVPLLILEIDHDDLASPLLVVNNSEDITSNGDTYVAFPFEIKLPNSSADDLPVARISICNVDRQIVAAIRSLTSKPTVTLSLVLASDPDTIEVGPYEFSLTHVSYNAFVVEGQLAYDNFLDEPYPGDRFTPGQYMALF